ncbi:uncharacterized protein LOC114830298 isoform X2 [Esox lucius]|uniref:uncharacterized protein LOC114830298 isoform X2 n=1 Tax=Esox lucius TaxID=8010 RepID=UPI00147742B1|nr:uncharacterized protein LOC114830298 isoform X2 [Esox lucius]
MARSSLPPLLLFGLSLFPVLFFQSQTMVVLRGESVTLMCSNISTVVGHVAWFKQVNRSEPVCISTMYSSHSSTVNYYLENRHFEMYSNNTTIFLNITKVEIADSGLYFCGFFTNTKHMVFVSAKCLNVQGSNITEEKEVKKRQPNGTTSLVGERNGTTSLVGVRNGTTSLVGECNGTTSLVGECNGTISLVGECNGSMDLFPLVVILGGVTVVLLIVIIILVLKIRRETKTDNETQLQSQNIQDVDEDTDLNYAALNFSQKTPRNKKSQLNMMEKDSDVVYASTR